MMERWDISLMPLAEECTLKRHGDILEGLRLEFKIAADGYPELRERTAGEICKALQGIRGKRARTLAPVYDAAAAVYCHELYFKNLLPGERYPSLPQGEYAERLRRSFGSPGNFFYLVRTIAGGTVSPGFLWLYEKPAVRHPPELGLARLPLYSLPDLSRVRPLMCIDLWEHAYIDRWGRDISGYADACLRQTDWQAVLTGSHSPRTPENGSETSGG